ncbi:hypothetical protein B0O80DRAFT_431975 [Mortierella sp. GBAus27b]|nr:hypothetical protein B0O80DRAFT_431975 [Mortierella sp. GBAus27b]
MAQALHAEQEAMKVNPSVTLVVVLDVVTRWNSTLDMLRRHLRLRAPLQSTCYGSDQLDFDKDTSEKLKALRMTPQEWNQVDEMIELLTPFNDMTMIFSSSTAGLAALVAPWIAASLSLLEDEKADDIPVMKAFRKALMDELKNRIKLNDDYLMASALHPNYNTLWFLDVSERQVRLEVIKQRIKSEYIAVTPTPSPSRHVTNLSDEETWDVDLGALFWKTY